MTNLVSTFMETNAGASIDHAREKSVMDSTGDLLPTDACTNGSWTSPNVAILVSMDIFGKSLHTCLDFSPAGLLVRMRYWIEQRFLLYIPFRSWWSIKVDKALVYIILNHIYYLILKKINVERPSDLHFFGSEEKLAFQKSHLLLQI